MGKSDATWRRHIAGIVVPAFLAVGLFWSGVFLVLLPHVKDTLYSRKQETLSDISDVTLTSLMALVHQNEAGIITLEEAKAQALNLLRHARYGPTNSDYFLVLDTAGTMLMHPYVLSTVGRNMRDYRDRAGNFVYKMMVDTALEKGEGFAQYFWQYNADSTRIEKKISKVRLFKPWNWVIANGMYDNDIQEEIAGLTNDLTTLAIAISIIVTLIVALLTRVSLQVERQRNIAEAKRENLVAELQRALDRVKQMRGLLPICAKCKKIRDDRGYWKEVEYYIRDHTDVEFSHGLCPTCKAEYMKELENETKDLDTLHAHRMES